MKHHGKTFTILLLAATFSSQAQNKMDSTFNMTLTRVLKASPAAVWKAWSDPSTVKQWWGPEGFTAPVANMDFREGGSSLVCMRTPDGFEIYTSWTYTHIQPMQKISFVQHFTDKEGKKLDPAAIGLPPGIPAAVPHTILLEELPDGNTRISITESGYGSQQATEISKMGMQQCLDKMEKILVGN